MTNDVNLNCPVPLNDHATVQLAHGGGGRIMRRLIEELFLPAFGAAEGREERGEGRGTTDVPSDPGPRPAPPHDSAVLPVEGQRLAFTTDSFVVSPLFFPGGDIGKLAVYGTVNDLAMAGAKPAYLSAGFILEEGLPMETLRRVVASMAEAARAVGRADRHRRHEGRRSRQGRRHLHQHGGHRLGAARASRSRPPGSRPATRSC